MPRRQVTHGGRARDLQMLVDLLRTTKRKENARGAVRLHQALASMLCLDILFVYMCFCFLQLIWHCNA